MLRVRMNQLFGQRFQAAPGGDKLHENLRAIAVVRQHPLDGIELTDNFPDPHHQGAAFILGMPVDFAHGATLSLHGTS